MGMQCSNLRSYEYHKSVEVPRCGIVGLNCSSLDAFEELNGNYSLVAILAVEESLFIPV